MPTKRKEYERFAVLKKDTGRVIKIKNMRYRHVPDENSFDPERYEAVKVSDDVQPGMVRTPEGLGWPS